MQKDRRVSLHRATISGDVALEQRSAIIKFPDAVISLATFLEHALPDRQGGQFQDDRWYP